MASRPSTDSSELEHPPAVSGTPTAWLTLFLLGLLAACWIFFQPLTCSLIRLALEASALYTGDHVRFGEVALTNEGWVRIRDVEWRHGSALHPSTFRTEWIALKPSPLLSLLFPPGKHPVPPIRECQLGRSRMLIDLRREGGEEGSGSRAAWGLRPAFSSRLLPVALDLGLTDLVMIGESGRIAVTGLTARLPERSPGRIAYTEATLDVGAWHHAFPVASVPALWESGGLRTGRIDLGSGILLKDCLLSAGENRLEFGFRGMIGRGLLRGDGALGITPRRMELTMVGESLALDAIAELFHLERKATGEIAQARFTFRGDPSVPLEADSSLRVVARNFRWEGRGWESLKLSALLTGRNLTLGELVLRQGHNEVVAEGRSRIPGDWRLVTRAPFTVGFHASLEDAGALASLAGPATGLPPLSGSLELQGSIRGADNRAEGSCELSGSRMKIHELPLDWIRAGISFEGDRTRLSYLEARSGSDRIHAEGEIANARPHAYRAKSTVSVGEMARCLAQLGVPPHPLLGGGSVRGTWEGEGEINGGPQRGTFQADISEWVSQWTRSGMSGSFEGSYAPGRFVLTKAELTQKDLRLSLQLQAAPDRVTLSDLEAVRRGTSIPLAEGSLSLPVDPWSLVSAKPNRSAPHGTADLRADLSLKGLRAEELTQLLGQRDLLRGTLEGTVRVAGTLASPDVHCALRILGFAASPVDQPSQVTVTADSSPGRLALQITEEQKGIARLKADLDLPLQAFSGIGRLALAGPDGKISGRAAFHGFPLDAWASLAGCNVWPLHGSRLEGEVAFVGSEAAPDLNGSILLAAERVDLPHDLSLGSLSLPLGLTPGRCSIGGGSAVFGDHPISVTGEFRRSGQGVDGLLKFSGKGMDLPLGLPKGLVSTGDADFSLNLRGGKADLVEGAVLITGFTGNPRVMVTPSFSLDPLRRTPPPLTTGFPEDIPLALSIRTGEPVPVGRNGRVSLDVKAAGNVAEPVWSGSMVLDDLWLSMPSGGVFVPEARLTVGSQGWDIAPAPAFGCTEQGFLPLVIAGPVDALAISSWKRSDRPIAWTPELSPLPAPGPLSERFAARFLPWESEPRWKAILGSEDHR